MRNPTDPSERQLDAAFRHMSLEETPRKKEPFDPHDPFAAYSKDIDCQRLTPVPDRDDIRTAKELIAFWRGEDQRELTEEKNPSDERTEISSTTKSSSPPSVSPRSKLKNMCLEDQGRILNGQPPNQKLIYILKNCSPVSWGPKKSSNFHTHFENNPQNNNNMFPPISQGFIQFSNVITYSTNYSQHNINFPSNSQGSIQFSNVSTYSTNYSQHNINFPSIPQGPTQFPNFNTHFNEYPQHNNNIFPSIPQGPMPFQNVDNQTDKNPQINNNMFPYISQGPTQFPNFNTHFNVNLQINNNMLPPISQCPTPFPNFDNQTVINPHIHNNMFPPISQGPTQFPNFNTHFNMNLEINNNMLPSLPQGPMQFPNFNPFRPQSLPFLNAVFVTNAHPQIHNNLQHNSDQSIRHRNPREGHK
ncbi:GATA zinc finger domain-containing protein 4-like [Trichogramma pretiosum]|uniref:GATA zinc finger domain-containing protein 4-like n=1 Tax=Trichogramma pretiosum TaxID=7493 RepID=UPI0006C9B20E|nr:GATA zinc finger domain-containing protein 4-like [Trichogramma pretiosum]XP_014222264.1 GATA zinc finger domain-containing protein 4-like [Trichogramma pretiosum]XP_023316168.1 GATA zinc finger domain-containing protein 4-like [Trichogramma pretiosum]XP_023316171.1 GATA zinc finger domain-containing protein 4-like [Trichogramma pretiosum]XP_023316173.1 GATA zinc finger domain-containing protein 4-like [Trichogramma pretiosum]